MYYVGVYIKILSLTSFSLFYDFWISKQLKKPTLEWTKD